MPIDDRTTNRSYQLPNAGNLLLEDVPRLRAALQAIDADIYARYTKTEVEQLISDLIQGAPGALDTLNELAAALGDDPNFATTVATQLALKANATDVYSKAEADARYVQGSTQAEMVFIATANQSVFTLTTPVINKPSALVTVDGVVQPTAEYSLNQAGTQLTLSEGVPVGTIVRVLALGVASAGAPADDTVTEPKLRTGAVSTRALAVGIQPVVASINSGPLAGFRNAIINGSFDIWQRGTSATAFGYATADRWTTRSGAGSGGSLTQSRQPFTLGQTDVPGEPTWFWRLVYTGTTSAPFVEQRIEGVRTLAGQVVTVSFWAKRSISSSTCNVELVQSFGTGGSPSAAVSTASSNFTVGAGWTYNTATLTLPSIAGKTLGSDGNNALLLRINCGGTGSFTFELAQVQLELGPVATPFERRPIGTELSLCQRYFEKSYRQSLNPGAASGVAAVDAHAFGSVSVGSVFWSKAEFKIEKRAIPTVSIWDAVGNINRFTSELGNNQTAGVGSLIGGIGTTSFYTNFATTGVGQIRVMAWVADAEL